MRKDDMVGQYLEKYRNPVFDLIPARIRRIVNPKASLISCSASLQVFLNSVVWLQLCYFYSRRPPRLTQFSFHLWVKCKSFCSPQRNFIGYDTADPDQVIKPRKGHSPSHKAQTNKHGFLSRGWSLPLRWKRYLGQVTRPRTLQVTLGNHDF